MKTAAAHFTPIAIALAADAPGVAPEWVELYKVGPVVGRDGRSWVNDNPQAVIDRFRARQIDIVVDWEHGSEIKGPNGERAPAAGWVDQLELRDNAIWGHVKWTEQGAADVVSGAYRYLSPGFTFNVAGQVTGIVSVGLVHRPNFDLAALSSENPTEEEVAMSKKITDELGLVDGASDDQVVAAIAKLKSNEATALARANQPDIKVFVPRADFDAMERRATAAEAAQAAIAAQSLAARADELIERGLAQGKITPATKDFYRAMCRDEAGLKSFDDFLGKAVPVVALGASGVASSDAGDGKALSAEEVAVCRQLGLTPEQFAKGKLAA